MDETGRRTLAFCRHRAGNIGEVAAALDRGEQQWEPGLALAAQHTINSALAMFKYRRGDKRCAVSTDADENTRQL